VIEEPFRGPVALVPQGDRNVTASRIAALCHAPRLVVPADDLPDAETCRQWLVSLRELVTGAAVPYADSHHKTAAQTDALLGRLFLPAAVG
jgi:hypothetical protein